jgi:hypothetical protein
MRAALLPAQGALPRPPASHLHAFSERFLDPPRERVDFSPIGVPTKEQVRESRNEEVIADVLAFMILDDKPPSRSEVLDDFFGYSEGEGIQQRYEQMGLAVQKHTVEVVTSATRHAPVTP